MRWLRFGCLLLACILPLPVWAEDWTTADGKVYHDVTIVGQEDDGVRITYDGGVGKIPYYELPVEIQRRFGQDVDSLAAKKHAVDLAIADAVKSAANAQVVLPAPTPGSVTVAPAPNVSPAPAPGPVPAPATAPGSTPSKPASTASTPNKPAPAPAAAPGKPNPSTAANPQQPTPSQAPVTGNDESETTEPLVQPISRTPNPGVTGLGGKALQLSVANYSYNETLDVCYLDSPPIDVYTGNAPKAAPGQGSSLTLRAITDGRTPQTPDRYELTLVCVGGSGGDLAGANLVFITDNGPITVADGDRKDSGTIPGGAQLMRYISFYLPAAAVQQFGASKKQSIIVGGDTYYLEGHQAGILRTYLSDTSSLQPETSSYVRSFYKWLSHLPSFFGMISTICEYVILGSFGLLVMASVAAFILGISRFIKM